MEFEKDGKKIDVNFSQYSSEDFPGYIRCINGFYHGSYPHKDYLNKELVDGMVKQGKLMLVCGKSDGGEIISISGVNFASGFGQSAIMTLRVVDHRYSGMGIGRYHEDIMLEKISGRSGFTSVYAELMQSDGQNQKCLEKKGFVNTGLRLSQYSNLQLLKSLKADLNHRVSAVVMCRNYSVNDVGKIYAPPELELFISEIYRKLGVKFTISNEKTQPKKLFSAIEEHVYAQDSSINFTVDSAGAEFKMELKRLMEKYKGNVLICYLNARDPSALYAYDQLMANKFIFTGIKPLNGGAEYLMFSLTNIDDIDVNGFPTDSPGKRMLYKIEQIRRACT